MLQLAEMHKAGRKRETTKKKCEEGGAYETGKTEKTSKKENKPAFVSEKQLAAVCTDFTSNYLLYRVQLSAAVRNPDCVQGFQSSIRDRRKQMGGIEAF